jgi:ligand-binding sensor domain-containing protein
LKSIKSLDIILNFKLFGVSNCLNTIAYRFRKCLLCFFIFSNSFTSYAQFNENYFNKVLIEIGGEEVFDVTEIIQDHRGHIWMETNLGLIRYNGFEGKTYNTKINASSIVNDDIKSLFVDHKGDLWIGSNSGLNKYNFDCDCLYQYPSINDNTSLIDIRSIVEDNNKDIWIGTQQGGLFRYDRKNKNITRFFHPPPLIL